MALKRDGYVIQRRHAPSHRLVLGLVLLAAGLLGIITPPTSNASQHVVYIAQIDDEIDLGLAAYLNRVLEDAEEADAAAVILEINTPGGRLDAALEMRDAILDSEVDTIAFVNREAFSAGALIAIAAEQIYMTPGAVIGAATPVLGTGETADEKVVSAVRTTFESTAELRGRDPRVAEAMVDPSVEIDGLIEEGRLLTLTTTEALAWGYADGVVEDRAALLDATGLADAAINDTGIRLAERLVRILTNPLVASLLISFGTLLILAEIFTAGFGLLGIAGAGLIAAFFWGHMLAGLAGWEGVALVILGLVLLVAEALIVPGFGIAGILGLAALLGGAFISLVNDRIVTDGALSRAGVTVGGAFLILLVGGALLLWLLPQTARVRGLVLQSKVGVPDEVPAPRRRRWSGAGQPRPVPVHHSEPPPATEPRPSLTGARGIALSDLRPGGFARIGDERVDVVTQGDFIPAGAEIEVLHDEGYRRVVRRTASPS